MKYFGEIEKVILIRASLPPFKEIASSILITLSWIFPPPNPKPYRDLKRCPKGDLDKRLVTNFRTLHPKTEIIFPQESIPSYWNHPTLLYIYL